MTNVSVTTTTAAASPPASSAFAIRGEPNIALPTKRLIVVTLSACSTVAAISLMLVLIGWIPDTSIWLGPAASLTVLLAMVAGLLVIAPWKTRPVGLWPSFWLGSTVFRLLLTPVLTYLLYSATSFGAAGLALHVVAAYLLALMGEVLVLAGYLNRTLPPPVPGIPRNLEGVGRMARS